MPLFTELRNTHTHLLGSKIESTGINSSMILIKRTRSVLGLTSVESSYKIKNAYKTRFLWCRIKSTCVCVRIYVVNSTAYKNTQSRLKEWFSLHQKRVKACIILRWMTQRWKCRWPTQLFTSMTLEMNKQRSKHQLGALKTLLSLGRPHSNEGA